MPRQRACDRQRARSVLWPLWPPGTIGWERPCCRFRIQEKRPERKRPVRGLHFLQKLMRINIVLRWEGAHYRATQHSLEILRPRISRKHSAPFIKRNESANCAGCSIVGTKGTALSTGRSHFTEAKTPPTQQEDEGILAFWELSKVTVFAGTRLGSEET